MYMNKTTKSIIAPEESDQLPYEEIKRKITKHKVV